MRTTKQVVYMHYANNSRQGPRFLFLLLGIGPLLVRGSRAPRAAPSKSVSTKNKSRWSSSTSSHVATNFISDSDGRKWLRACTVVTIRAPLRLVVAWVLVTNKDFEVNNKEHHP
jgi:hypothetical protein